MVEINSNRKNYHLKYITHNWNIFVCIFFRKIKNKNKAPGINGMPNRAIQEAMTSKPTLFVKMHNASIKAAVFSDPWKIHRLVLLSKPKKPPEENLLYDLLHRQNW